MESAKPDEPEKSGNEKGNSAKSGSGKPMEMGMGMMKKNDGARRWGSYGDDAEDDEPARGRRGGGNPMQKMMGSCMAMCSEMLETMQRTTALAAYAQPELYQLFEEWLAAREDEVFHRIEQAGSQDPDALAEMLSLSSASVMVLLARLQNQGKIHLKAESIKAS
ncbi:cyclic nucleotide-binding domain-containing protein [Acidithiobacillus caldus]|uniref:MarR family transcriptional regulator n=1 Tax=Acidithiobacillus caldus TaxID=33059 RepID=UPI001F348EE8|nr:MarR family transcriptional regulator [Acidithiobacillus caldus]